jgi:hypothetical protein
VHSSSSPITLLLFLTWWLRITVNPMNKHYNLFMQKKKKTQSVPQSHALLELQHHKQPKKATCNSHFHEPCIFGETQHPCHKLMHRTLLSTPCQLFDWWVYVRRRTEILMPSSCPWPWTLCLLLCPLTLS